MRSIEAIERDIAETERFMSECRKKSQEMRKTGDPFSAYAYQHRVCEMWGELETLEDELKFAKDLQEKETQE